MKKFLETLFVLFTLCPIANAAFIHPKYLDSIVRRLDDVDIDVQVYALFAIKAIAPADPAIAKKVAEHLHIDSQRGLALQTLGVLKPSDIDIQKKIAAFLQCAEPDLRFHAARTLGKIQPFDLEVISRIRNYPSVQDQTLRKYIQCFVFAKNTDSKCIIDTVLKDQKYKRTALSALADIRPFTPEIVQQLKIALNDHPKLYSKAAEGLAYAKTSDQQIHRDLASKLKSNVANDRYFSAWALGESNVDVSLAIELLPLLKDSVFWVSAVAMSTLSGFKKQIQEPSLTQFNQEIERLKSSTNENDQSLLKIYVAHQQVRESELDIELLIHNMKDPEMFVRLAAGDALVRSNRTEDFIIQQIVSILEDPDPNLRFTALWNLKRLAEI